MIHCANSLVLKMMEEAQHANRWKEKRAKSWLRRKHFNTTSEARCWMPQSVRNHLQTHSTALILFHRNTYFLLLCREKGRAAKSSRLIRCSIEHLEFNISLLNRLESLRKPWKSIEKVSAGTTREVQSTFSLNGCLMHSARQPNHHKIISTSHYRFVLFVNCGGFPNY